MLSDLFHAFRSLSGHGALAEPDPSRTRWRASTPLRKSRAVFSAAAYWALVDATRKLEEIAVVSRPCQIHVTQSASFFTACNSRRVFFAHHSRPVSHRLTFSIPLYLADALLLCEEDTRWRTLHERSISDNKTVGR